MIQIKKHTPQQLPIQLPQQERLFSVVQQYQLKISFNIILFQIPTNIEGIQEMTQKMLSEFATINKALSSIVTRLTDLESLQKKRDNDFQQFSEEMKKQLKTQTVTPGDCSPLKRKREDFMFDIPTAVDNDISLQVSKYFFCGSVTNILPDLKSKIEEIITKQYPDSVVQTQKLPFAFNCVN